MTRVNNLDTGLDELLAEAGIGVWEWDPRTNAVTWDSQAERLYGMSPGSFDGTMEAFVERIHPDDTADVMELIHRVGERGGLYSVEHRIIWPDGTVRWVEGQGRIDSGPDGQPVRGLGIVYDVTDRATLERERDELRLREAAAVRETTASREALDFLIEASDALAGSLNTARVLERLARTLVDELADVCVIDLRLDEPMGWVTTGVATADGRYAANSASPSTVPLAIRRLELVETGALAGSDPELRVEPDDADLAGLVPNKDLEILAEPLISHGSTIGSIVIGRNDMWASESHALLKAIARRAAVALDHAELYRDRSAVADVFQRSMNPGVLPEVDGLEMGVLYRPATELVRLGGDFYDVFPGRNDSWVMAVGDICGKGVVAAGHAGLARSALRASAQASETLADALTVLNRTLMADASKPMLTAVTAQFSPADENGTRRAVVCCAGHPPPLVVRADGSVVEIESTGTMLGFAPDPMFAVASVELQPGEALVMFSDGVIETRRGDEFFGLERLAQALTKVAAAPAAAMAEATGATLDTWTAEPMSDDIVMLVTKVTDVE